MKGKALAVIMTLAFTSILGSISLGHIAAKAENNEPVYYEFTNEMVDLPVYASENKGFLMQLLDDKGNVLLENSWSYQFESVGEYKIVYSLYEDLGAGVKEQIIVPIIVGDTTGPAISLQGSYKRNYTSGDVIEILTAKAVDVYAGECAVSYKIENASGKRFVAVDGKLKLQAGEYNITYTAVDTFNNKSERTYSFKVEDALGGTSSSGEETSGCGSIVGVSSVAPLLTAVACLVLGRKKDEN